MKMLRWRCRWKVSYSFRREPFRRDPIAEEIPSRTFSAIRITLTPNMKYLDETTLPPHPPNKGEETPATEDDETYSPTPYPTETSEDTSEDDETYSPTPYPTAASEDTSEDEEGAETSEDASEDEEDAETSEGTSEDTSGGGDDGELVRVVQDEYVNDPGPTSASVVNKAKAQASSSSASSLSSKSSEATDNFPKEVVIASIAVPVILIGIALFIRSRKKRRERQRRAAAMAATQYADEGFTDDSDDMEVVDMQRPDIV